MKTVYSSKDNIFDKPMGIGLGTFDGLHTGHMSLINTLINESALLGLESMVYTFSKHPENILRKKLFTPLITLEGKKSELLGKTALDYLYFEEFNEIFSRIKPEVFIRDVLVHKFGMKLAVAGFNYRFGYRGQGDVKLLEEMGKAYGFKVIIVPPIKVDNDIVSSTLIRSMISKGDMERACKLLGRYYSITGEVKGGKRIGRELGFPTANIYPEKYLVLPHEGVYITKTLLNGNIYNSVTNIGRNPTFIEQDRISIETHLLDFDRDVYNEKIEVFFITKIRGEKKFKNKEELIEQLAKDINKTREFFALDTLV